MIEPGTSPAHPIVLPRTEAGRPGWRPSSASCRQPDMVCPVHRRPLKLAPRATVEPDGLVQPSARCPAGHLDWYRCDGWADHLRALDAEPTGMPHVPETDPEPADSGWGG